MGKPPKPPKPPRLPEPTLMEDTQQIEAARRRRLSAAARQSGTRSTQITDIGQRETLGGS